MPKLHAEELEALMRAGRGAEVRERLAKLRSERVQPEELWKIAQLCWRAGLPAPGLRLLQKKVRKGTANDTEKSEYAACLIRLEIPEEAAELLAKLDPKRVPQVWFYRALAKLGQWEHRKAIPLLKAYLKASGLTEYQRAVAKVNLCSALIFEKKHVEAAFLLRETTHLTGLRQFTLLHANCLELTAANFIYLGKFKEASPFLDRAEKLLDAHGNFDAFFVEKWRLIVRFRIGHDETYLDSLRDSARERLHWEGVRDADRFQALATRDPELIARLYFGTPFKNYRARIAEEGGKGKLPALFGWKLGKGSEPHTLLIAPKEYGLKPGQLLHRLATILASDFYRPVLASALYAQLFPNERYNVQSSGKRVHEAVRRLRQWLKASGIPLQIEEVHGAYRFNSKQGCTLLVPHPERKLTAAALLSDQLAQVFAQRDFNAKQAGDALKTPLSSLQRQLNRAITEGYLRRTGKGNQVRYRIARSSK